MPCAVGFPIFFEPGDVAFKQGKVARKLFAPGIGEGRHARQFILNGLLAAAHERQAALVADIGPAIQRVSAHSTHRPRYMIRKSSSIRFRDVWTSISSPPS
mgnify:CR=1 FL=1